jgi:hypothetical protein
MDDIKIDWDAYDKEAYFALRPAFYFPMPEPRPSRLWRILHPFKARRLRKARIEATQDDLVTFRIVNTDA